MSADVSPSTDEELMAAIATHDAVALETLYDRYSPLLYGLCLRILHRHADAQAVLSEVFFEIWHKGERFDPTRVSARTYLVTVARSRAVDHLRAAATRTEKEGAAGRERRYASQGQDPTAGPTERTILSEEAELVRAALGTLPEAQRESLRLAYFECLTHMEIAARTGIPLGTVKSNIRQGLLKLRGALAPGMVERGK